METADRLLKTSLDEVDKLLSSKSIVGEPIELGDETIVPLLSFGFGFGAGGGKGNDNTKGAGEGGGSGAGAGIKPVALVISDRKGHTRIEPISGAFGDAVGKLATSIGDVINKSGTKTTTDTQG